MSNLEYLKDKAPEAIMQLAAHVAWSPCKHFRQAMGYCPVCWMEYLGKEAMGVSPGDKG